MCTAAQIIWKCMCISKSQSPPFCSVCGGKNVNLNIWVDRSPYCWSTAVIYGICRGMVIWWYGGSSVHVFVGSKRLLSTKYNTCSQLSVLKSYVINAYTYTYIYKAIQRPYELHLPTNLTVLFDCPNSTAILHKSRQIVLCKHVARMFHMIFVFFVF